MDSESSVESDFIELEEQENELFSYFAHHNGCFAHTINLIVKDGMKEAGSLRNVITRASQIVSHVRKSTVSTNLLEGNHKLQAANVTRWNSEVSMIRPILRIPEEKLNELDTKVKLNTRHRVLLQELCDILITFETSTDCTQGDQIVTASLVVPSVCGLCAELARINTKFNNKLVTTLRKSTEETSECVRGTLQFIGQQFLIPISRWHGVLTRVMQMQRKKALITEANRLSPHVESPSIPVSSTAHPPTKRCKLFGFMNQNHSAPCTKNKQIK